MSDSNNLPDIGVAQERESALDSLGRSRSILGDSVKKKGGTAVIVVLAALALGFVAVVKGSKDKEPAQESTEITMAARKTVPPIQLKEEPPPSPPKEEPKPAPVKNVVQQPARPDQAELERLRLEAARLERERQMLEARMKSAIIAPSSQNIDPNSPKVTSGGGGSLDAQRGAQDTNSRYARSVSGSTVPMASAKQIQDLGNKVLQGKLIEAVLVPRANSDLPGGISCQVTRDVYSSDGSQVLIPWGSKIFGQYNAGVRKGQDRIFVVWNRLVTPSGISINIDSPGADQLGTAGMGGQVDTHFMEMFGASLLLSVIGAGATHLGDYNSDGSASYYREEVYNSMRDSADTILSTYANIPPTITVAPGTRVRILVAQDLDFSEVLDNQSSGQIESIKVVF